VRDAELNFVIAVAKL